MDDGAVVKKKEMYELVRPFSNVTIGNECAVDEVLLELSSKQVQDLQYKVYNVI